MLHLNLKEAKLEPRHPSSPHSSRGAGEGAWISSGGVVSPQEAEDKDPEKKILNINRNRKTPIFLLFYAGFQFFKSRVIIILWDHDNAHRDFKWLKVVSWVSEQLPRLKYRGIISNFVEITKQMYLKA